jgi:hypothetical protein
VGEILAAKRVAVQTDQVAVVQPEEVVVQFVLEVLVHLVPQADQIFQEHQRAQSHQQQPRRRREVVDLQDQEHLLAQQDQEHLQDVVARVHHPKSFKGLKEFKFKTIERK